ncbi:MAG TPA: hypothetical protein VGK64_16845, partial [Bryobacteraceae bacterium]
GHGDNDIEILLARDSPHEKRAERDRKALHLAVFEKLNQFPQRAFITTEGECEIEIDRICPAYRTLTVVVQRVSADERRPAGLAREFGLDRLRQSEAGRTNGNA